MQCTTTVRPEAEDWQPPTLGFNLQVNAPQAAAWACSIQLLSRLCAVTQHLLRCVAQDVASASLSDFTAERSCLRGGVVHAREIVYL